MSEGKYMNDSEDIILGVPEIYEKEGQLKNAYEIGKGWPHYKDFDFSDENFEFMGEVLPFYTLEAEFTEFPPPLEIASVVGEAGVSEAGVSKAGVSEAGVSKAGVSEAGVSKAGVSNGETDTVLSGRHLDTAQTGSLSLDELDSKLKSIKKLRYGEDKEIRLQSIERVNDLPDFKPADFTTYTLDEIDLRINGYGTKDTDIYRRNIIDNSSFSQDGVDKVNYSDAVIKGFNLDLGAGSANLDFDTELFEPNAENAGKSSVNLVSQINKRLQAFVKRAVSESGHKVKGGLKCDKETLSGIVDGIMDRLQNEIDEAEDISLEVQRTDWSRYRLLRAVTELLVVMELEGQV